MEIIVIGDVTTLGLSFLFFKVISYSILTDLTRKNQASLKRNVS